MNLRWAGVDPPRPMKISRHSAMAVFQRKNTIDDDAILAAG